MMNPKIITLVVFIVAYFLFVRLPHRRSLVALGGSLLLILTGSLSLKEAFLAVNWNVMGIFVGTLIMADVFMQSRVPAYLAELIVQRTKSTAWAVLSLCLLSGFISAFVENVATLLIVAPIALSLAKKLKINPVNMMIAIAVSSNLQGAATLIGDPPSMLLGGFAQMNFGDFFIYQGKPGIFFAVELGALVSFGVLFFIFRKYKIKVQLIPVEKVKSWMPTVFLVSLIVLLAGSSFFDSGFNSLAGQLCMIFGILALVWEKLVNKNPIIAGFKNLDWDTTFFLIGIFIIVGAVSLAGWTQLLADAMANLVGGNIFFGYTAIVLLSVCLSAFIDNVPFLAAMLPVAIIMSDKLEINPALFLFGLLIGASLGGNITPIGASANIVACGLLKKEGYPVSFKQFMKIGVPFTFAAVIAGYLFIWFIWG